MKRKPKLKFAVRYSANSSLLQYHQSPGMAPVITGVEIESSLTSPLCLSSITY